jgi:hypothetical protein
MTAKFQIEEYKQVRDEIKAREQSINQLFVIGVVASISILSAVSTFFSKQPPITEPVYAYVFLSPLAVIIPILYVLISHRRDLHRSGTYLHVFYEEPGLGPMWETRLAKFRDRQKGESLDAIPWTFWAITVVTVAGFVFTLNGITSFACNTWWLSATVTVGSAITFLINGHAKFAHASVSVRDGYYKHWLQIRNASTQKARYLTSRSRPTEPAPKK